MPETTHIPVEFKCTNCNSYNLYPRLEVIAATGTNDGNREKVLRCTTCGAENKITLDGYHFPNTETILKGGGQ